MLAIVGVESRSGTIGCSAGASGPGSDERGWPYSRDEPASLNRYGGTDGPKTSDPNSAVQGRPIPGADADQMELPKFDPEYD